MSMPIEGSGGQEGRLGLKDRVISLASPLTEGSKRIASLISSFRNRFNPVDVDQDTHVESPDRRAGLQLAIRVVGFAVSSTLLAACGIRARASQEEQRYLPRVTKDSKGVSGSGPQPTPEPTATTEVEKVVHCGILPDKFCNSGEPVIRPGRNIVTSIRFKAPPGTPISSLFAAKVSTVLAKEGVEPDTTLIPLDKTIPPLIIKGDLTNQLVDTNDKGVGEDDEVAKVGPTGEIFVTWSGYNPADKKTVSAQEIVKLFERFFPEVMQKQPVVAPLASAGGGWNVAEPKFPSGKP